MTAGRKHGVEIVARKLGASQAAAMAAVSTVAEAQRKALADVD